MTTQSRLTRIEAKLAPSPLPTRWVEVFSPDDRERQLAILAAAEAVVEPLIEEHYAGVGVLAMAGCDPDREDGVIISAGRHGWRVRVAADGIGFVAEVISVEEHPRAGWEG